MCEMETIVNMFGGGEGDGSGKSPPPWVRVVVDMCVCVCWLELLSFYFQGLPVFLDDRTKMVVDGHGCALHNPLGSLRLTHSAVMQELWLSSSPALISFSY